MKKQAKRATNSSNRVAQARGLSSIEKSRTEWISFSWPGPHPLSKVHPSEYQKVATMLCIQILVAAIGETSMRETAIDAATFYASLVPEELFKMCTAVSESMILNAQNKCFASRPQGKDVVVKMLNDTSALNVFLSVHSDAVVSTDEEVLEYFIEDIHLYYFDWKSDTSSD